MAVSADLYTCCSILFTSNIGQVVEMNNFFYNDYVIMHNFNIVCWRLTGKTSSCLLVPTFLHVLQLTHFFLVIDCYVMLLNHKYL